VIEIGFEIETEVRQTVVIKARGPRLYNFYFAEKLLEVW